MGRECANAEMCKCADAKNTSHAELVSAPHCTGRQCKPLRASLRGTKQSQTYRATLQVFFEF